MTFHANDDDRLWKDSQDEGWFRFSSPLRFIIFLIFIVCVIIGGWYFFSPQKTSS